MASRGESLRSYEETQGMISYKVPEIIDFGSIASHTFDNPGVGDKSPDTTLETDTFGEYSHPAAS